MNVNFEDVMESLNGIPCYNDSVGLTPMISIPWVKDVASRLQAAHDAEMKQLSKAEYHRGYEDGKTARNADEWQLDRERAEVVRRLLSLEFDGGSHGNLSKIARAVYHADFGWTQVACEGLRDELVRLMGGVHEGYTTTYDELGNERHKAVCELRKLRERDAKIWNIEISIALGLDLDASNDDVCDRLIYLLGADTILREDGDGMARGDFERGTVPCDSVGARDVPEEAVVDERNFSALETPETVENRQKPTEKGTIDAPIVSITDELRKFAETFRYEWYDEKDGSVCYAASDMPPSLDSVNGADYINAIADRIDAKHAELRRKLDAVRGIVDGS